MPIYRLFENQGFDPDHRQAMGLAFEGVLQELGLTDRRDDPFCETVARKIIELGQRGIREPAQLATLALKDIRSE